MHRHLWLARVFILAIAASRVVISADTDKFKKHFYGKLKRRTRKVTFKIKNKTGSKTKRPKTNVTRIISRPKNSPSKKPVPQASASKKQEPDFEIETYTKDGKLYYRKIYKQKRKYTSIFGGFRRRKRSKKSPNRTQSRPHAKPATPRQTSSIKYSKHHAKRTVTQKIRFGRRTTRSHLFGRNASKKPHLKSDNTSIKAEGEAAVVKKVSRKKTKLDTILRSGPFCFLHTESDKFLGWAPSSFIKKVAPLSTRCLPDNEFAIVQSGPEDTVYNIKQNGLILGFDDDAERALRLFDPSRISNSKSILMRRSRDDSLVFCQRAR